MDGTPTADVFAARDRAMMVVLSLGLLVVLVTAKIVLLPFPVETFGELVRWLLRLAIVAAADVLFVAMLATAAWALGNWTGRHTWSRRVCRVITVAMFLFAGWYGVASVPMYRMTMVPVTVELLSFSGGPALMASSLAPFFNLASVASLLAITLGTVAAIWWSRTHRDTPWLSRWMRAGIVVPAVLLSVTYASVCRAYVTGQWTDPNRWERRISHNPHTVFLSSCVRELFRRDRLTFTWDADEVDTDDFTRDRDKSRTTPAAVDTPTPQNVIVIVLESVGARNLSLYGGPHRAMPNLARLAAERGVVFDNVYAHAPSSPKGLIALAGSVYPRVDWKLISRDNPEFAVPLLPEVLGQHGYRSAYLHSGYWSWKNRDRFLRDRGVDQLIDADTLDEEKVFSWGVSDDVLFDAALEFIDAAPHKPFHVFLWTIETHHPYIADDGSPKFDVDDEEWARYLSAIHGADRLIARLVEQLEARGLADNTLIAVTGDHGEAFGQHGQRVHSFGVYDENVHVPLVLLHSSFADPNTPRRVSGVAQQIDIAPTLLGLAGIEAPHQWQGHDWSAELSGGVSSNGVLSGNADATVDDRRAYFYSTGNEVLLGVRDREFKYHYYVSSGYEELFDLAHDPDELHSVADEFPEVCRQHRARVAGLVEYQRAFLGEQGAR
jgi:phosphoglycerol transferase MdoB-like AlkP superfamily enzyme